MPYPQLVFMRPYQDLWNVVRTTRSTHKVAIFTCEWNITARDTHWTTKDWPKREDLIPGIMKQFVKALDRGGPCFQYVNIKFLALSEAK